MRAFPGPPITNSQPPQFSKTQCKLLLRCWRYVRSNSASFWIAAVAPTGVEIRGAAPLELAHPSGCQIHVFGVEHLAIQPDAADFVLRNRPEAVVVETALNEEHGSATGNSLEVGSQSQNTHVDMFQQLGRRLSWEDDPASGLVWQSLRANCGEQLVYVAAFAVSARILFGDVVKHATYRRLYEATTLQHLDYAFGVQSWLNYLELLEGKNNLVQDVQTLGAVDRIMLSEREATFCHVLTQAGQSGRGVVGVLGEAHLPGLQSLWESGEWRALLDRMDGGSDSDSQLSDTTAYSDGVGGMETPTPPLLAPNEEVGVRHALLESVIRQKSVSSVVSDLRRALSIPDESWEAYCWAHELYASPRMMLATLTREQLQRVCSGWQCDMWDVLAPLRAARPVNGGSGLAVELTADLRDLHPVF